MSPLPAMNAAGAELYEELWQLSEEIDESLGYVLANVTNALGLMRVAAMDLFEDRDGRPGYSQMLDVERAPAAVLSYLAQIAGTVVTVGAPEGQQRDEVRRRAGQARGRPASMISAVEATLTGDKAVVLVERVGGNAWQTVVRTRTAETPDPAATLKAAMSQKPVGIVLTHVVSDEPYIFEFSRAISLITADPLSSFTLADVT